MTGSELTAKLRHIAADVRVTAKSIDPHTLTPAERRACLKLVEECAKMLARLSEKVDVS